MHGYAAVKANNNTRKINYLGDITSEDNEECESEEVRQITHTQNKQNNTGQQRPLQRRNKTIRRKTESYHRRNELTRSSHMRLQWHKKLEKETFLPRRPDAGDWEEIKRIDKRLRKKKKNAAIHILGADTSRNSAT